MRLNFAVVYALSALTGSVSFGQQTSATLTVVITDPAGAVAPGVVMREGRLLYGH